jgi:hypothetical protein
MYHFVDLSDQEKLNRREQLDWYGWVAHISTLLPLLTVQIYMLISRYARSRRTTSKSVRRSAPTERSKWMTGPWDCLERFQMYALRALRIIEWYSDEDIWYAGIHLGTWGCLAFSALWTLWLVTLCVLETGQGRCCDQSSYFREIDHLFRFRTFDRSSRARGGVTVTSGIPLLTTNAFLAAQGAYMQHSPTIHVAA